MLHFVLIALFTLYTPTLFAETFSAWKKKFANDAVSSGLPKSYTLKVLKSVKFDPSVVKKDRNQVHSNKKLDYLKFMERWKGHNSARLKIANEKLAKNLKLLQQVEDKYGVEKEIIVSLWGVETYFGRITGSYDVVRSLATLAYEGRRRAFFEEQLKAALLMLYKGHTTRENLKGSWAGATGQCQFMPSNHHLAQDFDGDGRKDIWTNKADIFASIANFLKNAGWKKGEKIGILALNTKNHKLQGKTFRTANEYNKLGFTRLDGSKIQSAGWSKKQAASIPLQNSPVVLKGANYKALMSWNASVLFAAFNIIMINALSK